MVWDAHFLLWYNKIPATKETNYFYKFWFLNDFLSLKEKKNNRIAWEIFIFEERGKNEISELCDGKNAYKTLAWNDYFRYGNFNFKIKWREGKRRKFTRIYLKGNLQYKGKFSHL